MLPQVTVSLLLYKSEDHLEQTLIHLKNQTYKNFEVVAVNNDSKDRSVEIFKNHFPDSKVIECNENKGFAGGNNLVIKQSNAPYILLLNDDAFLAPDYIEKLVDFVEKNRKTGAASGFLYKFQNGRRTEISDGAELVLERNFRFYAKGEGKPVQNLPSVPWEVWGLSAPALMLRTEALQDVVIGEEDFFDSDFLAYKEDVDLAWRMRKRGWKAFVVPSAIAHHVRGVSNVENISQLRNAIGHLRRDYKQNYLAFRNHKLMLYKGLSPLSYRRHFFSIRWFELKKIVFCLFFAPKLLRAFIDAKKMKPKMLEKRRKIMQNATTGPEDAIEKWINK